MKTLTNYLMEYYKIQPKILLVYRSGPKEAWTNRCFYLDEKYNATTPYNHRSILDKEIIIEYDKNELEENKKLTDIVCKRLDADEIKYSKWHSGNRSIHVHIFVDIKQAINLSLLKKTFIRYYSKGLELPDLQLCANNHLVRAEFGLHEKTGSKKKLIQGNNIIINDIPQVVWEEYTDAMRESFRRRIIYNSKALTDLKGFKYILTANEFRASDDGHERALFMLIHLLKPQYQNRQDELIKFLQEWYHYSSGRNLSDEEISRKVKYHWKKDYTFTETYLNELLSSIGRSDLIETPEHKNNAL